MNLVRSAMAPETMVAAVAQNTVWKIRVVQSYALTDNAGQLTEIKAADERAGAAPNMMPKPKSQ